MSVLKVLQIPNPLLRNKTKSVQKVDNTIRKLMDDLKETCDFEEGAGLAATQVGSSHSVIVVMCDNENPDMCYYMANPSITWRSNEIINSEEGCLSVPGVRHTVKRNAEIKVSYLDYNNELRTGHFKGKMSRCIQHEVDHLNGILYIDHLSPLKRNMVMKKYNKFVLNNK